MFKSDGINFEETAAAELEKYSESIARNYGGYEQWYLKGRDTAEKSFVILGYENSGRKYKAVFAKQVESEHDLNRENLYLIDHTGVDLEYYVDGIFTRDQSLLFLERFLNRWRCTANEVLLVVPFIGFHYKNAEDALYQLWNWLEINVDISKTKLVTRKGTFNLFKKAQDNTGIPFDELVKWGLLEPLIDKMNQNETEFFQKSHAKYYVGVYDDYVEVLSGSFNIHQGGYFENITFRKYPKDFFKERYLHMFKDFTYAGSAGEELIHYMALGTGDDKSYVMNLKELYSLIHG